MLIISLITVAVTILAAVVVVYKRHMHLANIAFSLSLLSTAAVIFGDAMSIFRPDYMIEWKRIVFISEALMAIAWLLFSISFARTDYWVGVSRFSRLFIYLSPLTVIGFILIPMEDFFYSPEFASERILFLGNAGYIFNLIVLSYSILSIINLEATMRSSKGTNRGAIKYTILGVGGILAINIFYYSHALLYRSINMYLFPVRTGILLISILVIGYSLLRHKTLDTEFRVSRRMLYKSVSLLIVAMYLLGLGIMGEGLRYISPEAGKNITTFLGFIGALLVLMAIFSEKVRRQGIVFINKNFLRQKYDYREQWLQFTQRISLKHSFDELLSSIAEGFRDAIGAKGAAIWLKEKSSGEYICVRVLNTVMVREKPNGELVEFLENMKWIVDVRHAKCKEIVSLSEAFIRKTRASLIVPLMNRETFLGFIILEEGFTDAEYNFEDYDLLKTLSRQAMSAILNARLSDELTEAKEMEAMGRVSSFILHDLKNATSMLSLIVQNAEEHIDNTDFQRDAIKAIANTAEKMKAIMGKLKNLPRKTSLDFGLYDLGSYVESAIEELHLNGGAEVTFIKGDPVTVRFDGEEISKVIMNLIVNAFDATNNLGKVEIAVGLENNAAFVKVSDNGCGMSGEFIEKQLFRPFQTTKKKGLGIGLYQCKAIVEAHSGTLNVVSREGRGTDFIMYLPLNGSG